MRAGLLGVNYIDNNQKLIYICKETPNKIRYLLNWILVVDLK